MKATALRTFKDLKGKAVRKKGDTFEVTKKRFDEVNSTKYGTLVKEVKGDDKK